MQPDISWPVVVCRVVAGLVARLLKGSVRSLRPLSRYATIDPANLEDGNVLLCSVTPLEDIDIEPHSKWEPGRNCDTD